MQIKTTARYQYAPIRMTKILKNWVTAADVGENAEKLDRSYIGDGTENDTVLGKTV